MTDRILRWGLLSTARINRSLIPALRASKRSRLAAVASRSRQTAGTFAREWDIPSACESYQALLDDPQIDVVYNPLPNDLHAEWTIRALKAGKHVLCEKPLGLTLEEVDRMSRAAREAGRVLTEAFMYRHHPQTLKVREIVGSGALGELQLIYGCFTFMLTRDTHRSDPERGGGSLWDVGCYPVSYARILAGAEPLEVFGWQVRGPGGIDESFVGQLRFTGGIHAQFDCGFRSPLRSQIEIVGTQAVLTVPMPFKPGRKEVLLLKREDRVETIAIKGPELYLGEVEDMEDAVLLGRPPRISLADSRANTAAILALVESARTGKPVLL